jgi:hypothetical protein
LQQTLGSAAIIPSRNRLLNAPATRRRVDISWCIPYNVVILLFRMMVLSLTLKEALIEKLAQ